MLEDQRRPTPPGEIIRHDYLAPCKMSYKQLAEAIGISCEEMDGILLGKASITPDTAFRLARFFNTSADFWITLQINVDMWDTLQSNKAIYENIKGVA
jgi:addiction module HigA family antidote